MNSFDRKGKLFIISGPSGVGKGTVCKRLLEDDENLKFSVSMTTREIRPGEVDGKDYIFTSKEGFIAAVEAGELLEHAPVFDNFYGTPAAPVEEITASGFDVLFDIDVQGAKQIMEKRPDVTSIFLLPPSKEVLRERIINRGTESEEKRELRLSKAVEEMEQLDRYSHYVINDVLETAIDDVKAIIRAERCRVGADAEKILGSIE